MPRLTKRVVDKLEPSPHGDVWAWDEAMPGFGVRVKPSGHKSYLIQYRSQGRTRRLTLGAHGVLTPEEARKFAQQQLAEVAKGGNPAEDRTWFRKSPTVAELADRYLSEHAEPKKKLSSVVKDRQWLKRFIVPELGKMKVHAVTRADIANLHHLMRGTPYQANRNLEILRKMFNLAEQWGLRPDGSNPCRHVSRFKEQKRERYLNEDEFSRLDKVLLEVEQEESESLSVLTAIRLLLFTGCRLGEILNLKWEHVDFAVGCLRLPDSKTGAKSIFLGQPAKEILAAVPRTPGNPYVCPGMKIGRPLVGIHRSWTRIMTRAGLKGLRLHDLRHSFASVGVSAGLGLPILGALLGHSQPATTQRYAHLYRDTLQSAADMVAGKIAEAMKSPVGQKVLNFPKMR